MSNEDETCRFRGCWIGGHGVWNHLVAVFAFLVLKIYEIFVKLQRIIVNWTLFNGII